MNVRGGCSPKPAERYGLTLEASAVLVAQVVVQEFDRNGGSPL
jgi:hypothetical protein